MMFEQCKIVIFNNIIFMKKHRKIFQKNSMGIFRNFPEKYEIFRTNFPPHITTHSRNFLATSLNFTVNYNSNLYSTNGKL